MPTTVNAPSPAHPMRPLPTREPLPETIARPHIRLAWKDEPAPPAAEPAESIAPVRPEEGAEAPPAGAVSRLLTALAVRLISTPAR